MVTQRTIAEPDVKKDLAIAQQVQVTEAMAHAVLFSATNNALADNAAQLRATVGQPRNIAKTPAARLALVDATQTQLLLDRVLSMILDHCWGKFRMTTTSTIACRTKWWL